MSDIDGRPGVVALGSLAFLVGVGLLATPALAHVPGFAADNDDPGNATYVENPAKSWSFYDRIEPNESAYYRTSLESGDRLVVNTFTPRGGTLPNTTANDTAGSFDPGFVVLSPVLNGTTGVPPQVEVPEEYGARVVEPDGQPRGEFEPFTPAALYRHAELDTTVETSGTYYVVAYDRDGDPGNVGVVVGHTESFGVVEYVTVPFDRPRIHLWEGQSAWLVFGPMLVGFLAIFNRYVQRTDTSEDEGDLREVAAEVDAAGVEASEVDATGVETAEVGGGGSSWTFRDGALGVASGLYAATGVAVAVQTGIAVSIVGVTSSLLVTVPFVVVPLGLASYLLACATDGASHGRLRRGLLVGASLLGALTWAGFVLGPLLVLVAALLPE